MPLSLAKAHAIQLLASNLQQFRADVGFITESWFNDNISDVYTNITGFLLYRRDRIKRKGGCLHLCQYFVTVLSLL